jgi:hypothetical protein
MEKEHASIIRRLNDEYSWGIGGISCPAFVQRMQTHKKLCGKKDGQGYDAEILRVLRGGKMRDILQGLGGAVIIFAGVSAIIFTSNIEKLRFFDMNSPYVAVFAGLGVAIGILFAMCMILVTNYQMRMEQGQKLVEYLTTVENAEYTTENR